MKVLLRGVKSMFVCYRRNGIIAGELYKYIFVCSCKAVQSDFVRQQSHARGAHVMSPLIPLDSVEEFITSRSDRITAGRIGVSDSVSFGW